MKPLSTHDRKVLGQWSDHNLYNWTHAGYLNWDSALGNKRQHLQQYWAFALWSLARSAAFMNSTDRKVVDGIVGRGAQTYEEQGYDEQGVPKATLFEAYNGFPSATSNTQTTALRMVLAQLTNFGRSTSTATLDKQNFYSQDNETKRFTVSAPKYNAAVIGFPDRGAGGTDLMRLYDEKQRPLIPLATGDRAHTPIGLRVLSGGRVLISSQPGRAETVSIPTIYKNNTSGLFTPQITERARVAIKGYRIAVTNLFRPQSITTHYRASQKGKKPLSMMLTVPVWSSGAKCELSSSRPQASLQVRCTTVESAKLRVEFRGLPAGARAYVYKRGKSALAPRGTTEVRIKFNAKKANIIRTIGF
jgi:hypothetical protein